MHRTNTCSWLCELVVDRMLEALVRFGISLSTAEAIEAGAVQHRRSDTRELHAFLKTCGVSALGQRLKVSTAWPSLVPAEPPKAANPLGELFAALDMPLPSSPADAALQESASKLLPMSTALGGVLRAGNQRAAQDLLKVAGIRSMGERQRVLLALSKAGAFAAAPPSRLPAPSFNILLGGRPMRPERASSSDDELALEDNELAAPDAADEESGEELALEDNELAAPDAAGEESGEELALEDNELAAPDAAGEESGEELALEDNELAGDDGGDELLLEDNEGVGAGPVDSDDEWLRVEANEAGGFGAVELGGGRGAGRTAPQDFDLELCAPPELPPYVPPVGRPSDPIEGALMAVRRDRGLLMISARVAYDGGHFSSTGDHWLEEATAFVTAL